MTDSRPTIAEIAEQALNLIERRGWRQDALQPHDPGSQVCISEAIWIAAGNVRCTTSVLLQRALETAALIAGVGPCPSDASMMTKSGDVVPATPKPLVRWNDAPERTYEDVVLVLKRMAAPPSRTS